MVVDDRHRLVDAPIVEDLGLAHHAAIVEQLDRVSLAAIVAGFALARLTRAV